MWPAQAATAALSRAQPPLAVFSCRTASLWAASAESGGLRIASWPAVGMIRKVVCQAAAAEQMLFKLPRSDHERGVLEMGCGCTED